jgi:hypothetical protein
MWGENLKTRSKWDDATGHFNISPNKVIDKTGGSCSDRGFGW